MVVRLAAIWVSFPPPPCTEEGIYTSGFNYSNNKIRTAILNVWLLFCQASRLMISPGINFLLNNEGFQPLVFKKKKEGKRKNKGKKEKRNASRIFFFSPLKEEIIMAYVYVTNRVFSATTKISVECSGLPIKEDSRRKFLKGGGLC